MSDNKRTKKVLEDLGYKTDANETFSLERSLSAIQEIPFETKFNMSRGLELIPVNATIQLPEGARDYKFNIKDPKFKAKLISNGADDFPESDVILSEETVQIVDYGEAYHYTLQDLQRSAMNNFQLDGERAMAAAMAMNHFRDEFLAIGNSDLGITGFANNANVGNTDAAAAAAGANDPAWNGADKVPSEILQDLLNLVAACNGDRDIGEFTCDTLVLPPEHFEILASRFMSVDNTETVLSAFRRIRPEVSVLKWSRLADADGSSGPRAVAYARNPQVLEAFAPVMLDQRGPQERALSFRVYLYGRISGVAVRYPFAMRYMDDL